MKIVDNEKQKVFQAFDYNFVFDKENGTMYRWGSTTKDDPQFCPYGPEILDLEISVGDCSGKCPWCYKANSVGNGYHMSLETFKAIIDKMPETLTQVALGLTDVDANKDLVAICEYARQQGIIPNFTLAGYGLTDELLEKVTPLVGAVAVSVYPHNKELAYETAQRFLDAGVKQTNFHLLYYQENMRFVFEVIGDVASHKAPDINALVLLALKKRGRAEEGFTVLSTDAFCAMVNHCILSGVPIGFDSCSAPKFEHYAKMINREDLIKYSEPCESALMSSYIDVHGNFYPCSFMEGIGLWKEGISVLDCDNFLEEVWFNERVREWRVGLMENCRNCPVFTV